MNIDEQWIRLTEVDNAIDNLAMVEHFMCSLDTDMKWKWIILAVHQALYGFAVTSIWGTNSSSVLIQRKGGRTKLIDIWRALDRAKDSNWMYGPDSKPLVTSKEEEDAIQRICEHFRNNFEHFQPMHWSIEISGMPSLVCRIIQVIRKLAIDSNCVRYRDGQKDEVFGLIERIEVMLAE